MYTDTKGHLTFLIRYDTSTEIFYIINYAILFSNKNQTFPL